MGSQTSGLGSGVSAEPPQLYPDSGENSLRRTKKKEEGMNKRVILAWKTLAHCEPDSGGKVPRFESSVGVGGFLYADQERLEKYGEFI